MDVWKPFSILQIGVPGQLLDSDCGGVAVRKVRSLEEAVCAVAQHEFDAIVLGSGVLDVGRQPEPMAELAGSTPVLVQTDFVGPVAGIKQEQSREQDIQQPSTAEPQNCGGSQPSFMIGAVHAIPMAAARSAASSP